LLSNEQKFLLLNAKGEKMNKNTSIISILIILAFLLVTTLPCQADDIYGCYPKKGGTLRIVSDLNKCKTKTEYPVTLSGTAQQDQNPVPNFGGNLCWSFLKTEDQEGANQEGPFIFNARIKYNGGGYYTVQGGVMFGEQSWITGGTAAVVGNKILITLSDSQDHSPDKWFDSGVLQMKVDTSTLNGTFKGNYISFNNESRQSDMGYGAGTVTLTSCN
jgi:hypothetical protein